MRAGVNRDPDIPASFYHFAFVANSPAALAKKRDELHAKGIKVTDIVDHGRAQTIYFKDPNGLPLNIAASSAISPRMTRPCRTVSRSRDAWELHNTLNAKEPAARSGSGTRKA